MRTATLRTPIAITAWALAAAGALFTQLDDAVAFPHLKDWHTPASGETKGSNKNRAGAAGLYGTGGPYELGVQCAHCHIKAEGKITVDIAPSPPFTVQGNDTFYKPGQTYAFTVTMKGEHKSGGGMNNLNGFSASFESPDAKIMGTLTSDVPGNSSSNCPANAPDTDPSSGTTFVYGDCHGILFLPRKNNTQWKFSWTAPAAGKGQVTIYWGAVDGDTAGDSSLNDDVAQGSIALLEGK